MPVIDAVFVGGEFRPLVPVHLPENLLVRLTVEPVTPPPTAADGVAEHDTSRDRGEPLP